MLIFFQNGFYFFEQDICIISAVELFGFVQIETAFKSIRIPCDDFCCEHVQNIGFPGQSDRFYSGPAGVENKQSGVGFKRITALNIAENARFVKHFSDTSCHAPEKTVRAFPVLAAASPALPSG